MQVTSKVAPWKRQEVDDLTKLLRDSPVVAVALIDKLPSAQFQMVRESVRGHMQIRVAKNNLIRRAIENVKGKKEGVEALEGHLQGQIALIGADVNPFKLFKLIEGSKAKAPAKAGDLAPYDIEIKKGDTPFKPGPIVGDLQKAGIPARIEGGKVVIGQDKVVAREGAAISAELAAMLTRLEILPMVVGLDVRAVWEKGTIYGRDVLAVDEAAVMRQIMLAHAQALEVSSAAGYVTKGTADRIIGRAFRTARGVAVESGFVAKGVEGDVLARAQAHALGVAQKLPDEASSDTIKSKLKR